MMSNDKVMGTRYGIGVKAGDLPQYKRNAKEAQEIVCQIIRLFESKGLTVRTAKCLLDIARKSLDKSQVHVPGFDEFCWCDFQNYETVQ